MNQPESCKIEYLGFKNPQTPDQLNFEILGLETAISEANKRISILKQSKLLVEITIRDQGQSE